VLEGEKQSHSMRDEGDHQPESRGIQVRTTKKEIERPALQCPFDEGGPNGI
jgi:hypothetical protein